ncbi:MAG: TIGR02466 family protein [Pseudohongiella sp.]|nr:TIGR02466 family protein [Pseudohongiella sp.]MDO9521985.1 TIGR02466 family protein [Pseudohongiella sp.]
MQHDMMNMFAVPVYRTSLGRTFSRQEMEFFKHSLNGAVPAINNQSSVDKRVLASPAMADIRSFVEGHLAQYLQTVFNTSNQVRLQITQSWLTLSGRGQSHHVHTHPNSVVSGVLYINLAPVDGINFYRNEDNIWYELVKQQDNYYNAFQYFVQSSVGDLLLFPSNVRHGVREVTEDVQRVSLSFNTFFSGHMGRDEFSNALTIDVK